LARKLADAARESFSSDPPGEAEEEHAEDGD
jgi:hypothetical protein